MTDEILNTIILTWTILEERKKSHELAFLKEDVHAYVSRRLNQDRAVLAMIINSLGL